LWGRRKVKNEKELNFWSGCLLPAGEGGKKKKKAHGLKTIAVKYGLEIEQKESV
jgi:hypothetical protein